MNDAMVYGEKLTQLNPCDPRTLTLLLTPILRPDAKLVDVGCGRGATLQWLSRHTRYRLYGTEPEKALRDVAALDCPEAVLSDAAAENLPYADDYFDAAIMECVFSLLADPAAAAAELARVICLNGILLFSDVYSPAGVNVEAAENPLLRNIYSKETLEAFFENSGFAVLSVFDHTKDLRSMFAQMIMDGTAREFLDSPGRKALRRWKTGYGIWIFKKTG
ncbi:MAG: class I SAM-dependent methyltransferase [Clostridiales bacterium]|nr:class I SAM-dependent methyltransferase [Clostridiales bacterium]